MSVEIKICGITNLNDAEAAVDAGADYLGFIFYSKSPRSILPADAGSILKTIGGRCRGIGVFVNETRARVLDIAGEAGLYAVQLHGDEDPADFRDMPVSVWRAMRGVDRDAFSGNIWAAERYVIDSDVPGMYGGTGVISDWAEAAQFARESRVMLSGGLTPENVRVAVETVMPLGVDVASGVEKEPGLKDHARLREFIKQAKGLE